MPSRETDRRLVLTQGAPDGIGPELLLRLAAEGVMREGDEVYAGSALLERRARRLEGARPDITWAMRGLEAIGPHLRGGDELGQFAALERAVDSVESSEPGTVALVTAPIDKAEAAAEGLPHPGHTEYLAERAGVDRFAMLMAGPQLRVALATIHIPLARVPNELSTDSIVVVGELLAQALTAEFGVPRPRIGVLGLNPHAGEAGLLGDEEIRIIAPAVERLRDRVPNAIFDGPTPADTAFPLHARGHLDGVVAMYHDQGLGPFKLVHFDDGVNMTLGLPYVRTSPDHGTARDLCGTGTADPSSMSAAVRFARGSASDAWPS